MELELSLLRDSHHILGFPFKDLFLTLTPITIYQTELCIKGMADRCFHSALSLYNICKRPLVNIFVSKLHVTEHIGQRIQEWI